MKVNPCKMKQFCISDYYEDYFRGCPQRYYDDKILYLKKIPVETNFPPYKFNVVLEDIINLSNYKYKNEEFFDKDGFPLTEIKNTLFPLYGGYMREQERPREPQYGIKMFIGERSEEKKLIKGEMIPYNYDIFEPMNKVSDFDNRKWIDFKNKVIIHIL